MIVKRQLFNIKSTMGRLLLKLRNLPNPADPSLRQVVTSKVTPQLHSSSILRETWWIRLTTWLFLVEEMLLSGLRSTVAMFAVFMVLNLAHGVEELIHNISAVPRSHISRHSEQRYHRYRRRQNKGIRFSIRSTYPTCILACYSL